MTGSTSAAHKGGSSLEPNVTMTWNVGMGS